MPIFQSLANILKALAVGERVKITAKPETGLFPNPMEGEVTQKDEAGNLSLKSTGGIVQLRAADIISITRLST
ncbi:MAG TPA: hypothetical protein VLA17_05620 [Candidatus Limnocylindria bacterium]|nr:hypothetical protein [Candidatus Limnocylindria bacterium]